MLQPAVLLGTNSAHACPRAGQNTHLLELLNLTLHPAVHIILRWRGIVIVVADLYYLHVRWRLALLLRGLLGFVFEDESVIRAQRDDLIVGPPAGAA